MTSKKRPSILSVALLIAGAAVGAGILGLPVQTGMAGALPALIALSLMWLVSLTTSWIIADSYLRGNDAQADLASIYQHELGAWGKWLTVVGYLINYYGIMVAYLKQSSWHSPGTYLDGPGLFRSRNGGLHLWPGSGAAF